MKRFFAIFAVLVLATSVVSGRSIQKQAQAARREAFFFIQMADTQLGFSGADMKVDTAHFEQAIAEINRLKPAFVIISGDLITGVHSPKQIRQFWQCAHQIDPSIPLHLVSGNHDVALPTPESIRSYEKLFGPDHYSFPCNGSEFIVIDTTLIHDAGGDPTQIAAQRKWFEDELAASKARNPNHIFVCGHHSWFLKSPDEKDQYYNMPLSIRSEYLDLMSKYGVEAALAGHYHRNAIAKYGSLEMITTSAISRGLGSDAVGFRVFKVYRDHIEHQYYALDKAPEKIELRGECQ